jgi:hypothetical protein
MKVLVRSVKAKKSSQQISRDYRNINDEFKYIKYTYLYVDENNKEPVERTKGDFKGYHEIGKSKTTPIKADGKVVGWTWEQMYQKD